MICDEGVERPVRKTVGSAGYDFHAPHDFELKPGEWTDIDTGVRFDGSEKVKCPISGFKPLSGSQNFGTSTDVCDVKQWVMLLFPRSGLGTKYGVRLRNVCGIIDMTYRDNIRACMTSDVPITIHKGERFMQGVIVPFGMFCGEVWPTEERKGGYGSTGL